MSVDLQQPARSLREARARFDNARDGDAKRQTATAYITTLAQVLPWLGAPKTSLAHFLNVLSQDKDVPQVLDAGIRACRGAIDVISREGRDWRGAREARSALEQFGRDREGLIKALRDADAIRELDASSPLSDKFHPERGTVPIPPQQMTSRHRTPLATIATEIVDHIRQDTARAAAFVPTVEKGNGRAPSVAGQPSLASLLNQVNLGRNGRFHYLGDLPEYQRQIAGAATALFRAIEKRKDGGAAIRADAEILRAQLQAMGITI